jgi:hypothetical protein
MKTGGYAKTWMIRGGSACAATLLAVLLTGCDCNYFVRLFDSQCRTLAGDISHSRITFTPPACGATNNVKLQLTCPAGSAQLCNHYSNGAAVYAVLIPDPGIGAGNNPMAQETFTYFDGSNGQAMNTCFDLWYALPSLQISEVSGIYVGQPQLANQSVTCDDTSCLLSSVTGCFYDFTYDPNNLTYTQFDVNGNPIAAPVAAGNYLACAFFDSTNAAFTVPIPPFGSSLINYLLGLGQGPFSSCMIGGTCPPDNPLSNIPVPASAGGAGVGGQSSYLTVTVGASTVINFNSWNDSL